MVKNVKFSALLTVILSLALLGTAPALADSGEAAAKMTALETVLGSRPVRRCQHQFFALRRIGNTCTRALDLLAGPVADAKLALTEEEARVRKLACPTVIDYGCTEFQIRYRQAADLLADGVMNLRLTEDESLSDRRDGKWWDKAFVKDNRLSAIWADDFIGKAKIAYEAAVVIVAELSAKASAK